MAKTPDQLLKQQQTASQVSGVVSGVANLANQGINMVNSANSIQTNAPAQQMDAYGRPQYNLGNFQQDVNAIKPQGANAGEILSGAANGAMAGSAFGPWGTAIGGAVGAGSAAIFGRIRRDKMRSKQRIAQGNLFTAQQLYNRSVSGYNDQQSAMARYQDMTNPDQRMNNLYTFNQA